MGRLLVLRARSVAALCGVGSVGFALVSVVSVVLGLPVGARLFAGAFCFGVPGLLFGPPPWRNGLCGLWGHADVVQVDSGEVSEVQLVCPPALFVELRKEVAHICCAAL